MNSAKIPRIGNAAISCIILLVLTSFLVGCKSTRVDWASRLGQYTYDQAVAELGPPDKEATLSDGARVCEWMTRRGNSGASMGYYGRYGYGPYYPYRGYAPGYYIDSSSPDYWLRLTFGPDGRLSAWRKLTR